MKKKLIGIFLALCTACSACVCGASAASGTSTVASSAANGVVQVYTETTLSDNSLSQAIGSGFGVGTVGEATDIFITNRHVVTEENGDGSLTQAQRVYIMLDEDSLTIMDRAVLFNGELTYVDGLDATIDANYNRMVECKILYVDDTYDFAVLQAAQPIEGRVALELADSAESASVGEQVYALGYPAASDELTTETGWVDSGNTYSCYVYQNDGTYYTADLPIYTYSNVYNSRVSDVTVTTGNISRFTTMTSENNVEVVQHDAAISSGNSGGPLVSSQGQVLGINTYGSTSAESLNYTVYIDYVRDYLDSAGIAYNVSASSSHILRTVLIVVIAVLVAAAIVIVLLAVKKKKPQTEAAGPASPDPMKGFCTSPTGPVWPAAPSATASNGPAAAGRELAVRCTAGQYAGRQYVLNSSFRIGRSPQSCNLIYPDNVASVSPVHCELRVENGTVLLTDLGSAFGTYLGNCQRLESNQTVQLHPGDQFFLASPDQAFEILQV